MNLTHTNVMPIYRPISIVASDLRIVFADCYCIKSFSCVGLLFFINVERKGTSGQIPTQTKESSTTQDKQQVSMSLQPYDAVNHLI